MAEKDRRDHRDAIEAASKELEEATTAARRRELRSELADLTRGEGPIRYRSFEIGWDADARAWAWTHEDFDGPGDPRSGHVWRGSLDAAKAEVDAFLEAAVE